MSALDNLYDRFLPGVRAPASPKEDSLLFLFSGSDILLVNKGQQLEIPTVRTAAHLAPPPASLLFIGQLDNVPCFAAQLPPSSLIAGNLQLLGLRQLFGAVADTVFWIAARAVQIVAWDRTHRFCGCCGAPTDSLTDERAKECKACGLLFYPRISPAVIICVERGDEVLLARAHRLPQGVFSVIAGFVEAGETLEQAAEREILEEVGVAVRNLRYVCSQPWPFPNSLMIAFTAEYASGDIRIDPNEIAEAGWFRASAMPRIPGPLSVSRRLLDDFLRKHVTA